MKFTRFGLVCQVWLVASTAVAGSININSPGSIVNMYNVSDAFCERDLDGLGGISGGGAVSRLLPSYEPEVRSQILDYLFKPNFGASLHVLKVEIGSDCQSTDGTEASHMRDPWTENYERGYEWMMMKEAKARNPAIKLYGLAWGYPQWLTCNPGTLSNCTGDVYTHRNTTAEYIVKWVAGAKSTHNLSIDYVSIWNERPYDLAYIVLLRSMLIAAGLQGTQVVAPDQGGWGFAADVLANPDVAASVYAIGSHYPGEKSSAQAEQTGKPLWASEETSTYNNQIGAACWARAINRNFVTGNMTSSLNWNLISAYAKGTNWYRAGLMNAMHPWAGSYGTFNDNKGAPSSWSVGPMIWASAHTTQFTQPGWGYLSTGVEGGSGSLNGGGTYVTLKDFSSSGNRDWTMVIEKLSFENSACVRGNPQAYTTIPELATFTLQGGLSSATVLYVYYTHWAYGPGDETVEFAQLPPITVVDGVFQMNITVDSIFTLTTLQGAGSKGTFGAPPAHPSLFPTAHTDGFASCAISSEADYFMDMGGAFECVLANDPTHGTVMRQMVPLRPVPSGGDLIPFSLIGSRDAVNMSLVIDAFIEEDGASVMLGVHAQMFPDNNGAMQCAAALFALNSSGNWGIWYSVSDLTNGKTPVSSGVLPIPILPGTWHSYRVDMNGSMLNVWIDSNPVVVAFNTSAAGGSSGSTRLDSGHGLVGTMAYGHFTQFDNVQVYSAYTQCGTTALAPGAPVSVMNCGSEVGPSPGSAWDFNGGQGKNGSFSLRAIPSLCLSLDANAPANGPSYLSLATCDENDAAQQWTWTFNGISPDGERTSVITNPNGRCIDIPGANADIGSQLDAWGCGAAKWQNFFYDYIAGEIGNEWGAVCVGVC